MRGAYLENFTLVSITNLTILNTYNLFIGKEAPVLFRQKLAALSFTGSGVFIPVFVTC
jgi:hypothetical protein